MSTSLRTFTLAAAAMLAAPAPVAPQVGEILKVPQSVWTNINRFVFLVAFDVYEPGVSRLAYEHHLSKLESYKELHAACRQWGQETFPALQKLAAELAKDDIGKMLEAMKGASEAIAAGRGDLANHRSVFETQSKALEERIGTLSKISETATRQLERLRVATKTTIFEYKRLRLPPTEFVEVGADPDAVLSALNAANDRWKWLMSDVKELRKLIGKSQTAGFEALYAHIGLDTWKDIARSAQGFMTDVPRQQRFLSGDNYYDNCGPAEGKWYTALNLAMERDGSGRQLPPRGPRFLSLGFPADGNTRGYDPGAQLRLADGGQSIRGDAANSWQFQKLGRGWWRVLNRTLGDSKALDGGKGPAQVVGLGAFSGQYWRFLPAGKWGGCRLINSYMGDLNSLTAQRRAGPGNPVYDIVLADTTNELNQQWRLTDVTILRPR